MQDPNFVSRLKPMQIITEGHLKLPTIRYRSTEHLIYISGRASSNQYIIARTHASGARLSDKLLHYWYFGISDVDRLKVAAKQPERLGSICSTWYERRNESGQINQSFSDRFISTVRTNWKYSRRTLQYLYRNENCSCTEIHFPPAWLPCDLVQGHHTS